MDEIVRAVRDCPSGALSLAFDGEEARDLADWHGTARARDRDHPGRPLPGHRRDPADRRRRAATCPGPRAPPASTTRSAAAGTRRTSRSAAACTGTSGSATRRPPGSEPTLFEWAGGLPALTRMTRLLYEKHVPADDLLAPLFATMPRLPAEPKPPARPGPRCPDPAAPASPAAPAPPAPRARPRRSPSASAPGRPPRCTAPSPRSSAPAGSHWPSASADEAGLPADPEFRAALASYLEWASRADGAPAARLGLGPTDWARPDLPPRPGAPTTASRRRPRHAARPGRDGQLRRAHQAAVPRARPQVHDVRLRPVVRRRRPDPRRRHPGTPGQRHHAL